MSIKPLQLPAHDPKVKKIILEGISILQSQSNPNVAKVAQELTATHGIVCPYHTFYRRFNGSALAASDAHIHQQHKYLRLHSMYIKYTHFVDSEVCKRFGRRLPVQCRSEFEFP
jgi:hypothetical protein